jgi:hypothetical protein
MALQHDCPSTVPQVAGWWSSAWREADHDKADQKGTGHESGRASVKGLEDPDAMVLHQAHPAKLAVDAASTVTSLWLLWRGKTKTGFAVHYLAPLAASFFVLRGDVARLRDSAAGRYVLTIPQGGHALRAASDTLMVRGARRRKPALMAAGALGVAAGWSSGLLARRPLTAPPPGRPS